MTVPWPPCASERVPPHGGIPSRASALPGRRRPRAGNASRVRPCASPYDASMSMTAGTFMTPIAQPERRPREHDGSWDGREPAFDRARTPRLLVVSASLSEAEPLDTRALTWR